MTALRLSTKELIWCFGLLVSFIGLPIGVLLSGKGVFSAENYTPVLPSLTFIATSICLTSLIEYFDLTITISGDRVGDHGKKKILIHFIIMMLALLFYFVTFVKNIQKSVDVDFRVGPWELILNIIMILIVAILHIRTRRVLESFR